MSETVTVTDAVAHKTHGLTSAVLFRDHAQRVAVWAGRLGGPRRGADLEDVVQEVFLRVHRALSGFRGEAEVTTWLYRITENVVRARMRKEKVRRFLGLETSASRDADADECADIPSPRPSPEQDVEQKQRARMLYDALDGLADIYRNPFILFEIEGLSGEEVARLTGVKLPTLWVRLSRARQQVTTALTQRQDRKGRHARP